MAGLDILPETLALEVLARGDGVDRPLALGSEPQDFDCTDEDGTGRRSVVVLVSAHPKNDGTEAEHNGG